MLTRPKSARVLPRRPVAVLCLGLLAGCLTLATATPSHAAGLLIADGGLGGVLELDEHTVRVTINNGIAVTEVTQVFRNTENRQVEVIRELGQEDRFELITFNVAPQTLFKELRSVTDESKNQAFEFLRVQQGKGGTILRSAMATAYRYGNPDRPLNVVILSDGLTEQSERTDLLNLIQCVC